MRVGIAILLGSAWMIAGCDWTRPKSPDADLRGTAAKRAQAQRLKQACGSAVTYDRLKALTFDQAAGIRGGTSALLDQLSAAAQVRMEAPVAKSRDEALNVTVCQGRFVLELPPGTEDAFDGDRRLEADIEYAAQEAVDGSGLVYQMQGAEPIIYRLAAIDLKRNAAVPQRQITAAAPTAIPAAPEHPAPAPRPVPTISPPRTATSDPDPRPRPEPAIRDASTVASRPSFNCRYARSQVEKMICSSDRLAARDRAMSSAFYAALANADPRTRSELRASRDHFLRVRERCANETCVANIYSDRMGEIRHIAGDD